MIHTVFSPEFGKNHSKGWAGRKKTESQILVVVFLFKKKKSIRRTRRTIYMQ